MGRPKSAYPDLPVGMCARVSNGGTYYYSREGKRKTALGNDKESAIAQFLFLKRARAFKAMGQSARKRESWLAISLHSKKKAQAKTRGIEFALTVPDVQHLCERSGGRCEVTGIPFTDEKPDGQRVATWAPSIDRIDSSRGYSPDNVRLVCIATNVAMNSFGDGVFKALVAARARQSTRRKTA